MFLPVCGAQTPTKTDDMNVCVGVGLARKSHIAFDTRLNQTSDALFAGTGACANRSLAYLSAAEHKRAQLTALGQRNPGGQQGAHRRKRGALAEPHQNAQHNQRRRAAQVHRPRRQQREDGRRQDAAAERPFAAELFGQQTAGQMGGRVAPVERRQNDALQLLRPVVDAVVDHRLAVAGRIRQTDAGTAGGLIVVRFAHHLGDGDGERDAHRVRVHQRQEAHDGEDDPLRDDEACVCVCERS